MDEELSQTTEHIFYDDQHHLRRRWKARLMICVIMLFLAFISLALVGFHSQGYWIYSKWLSLAYALLSTWLFWYLNRGSNQFNGTTLRHQLFHWVGLLVALYLIDLFVRAGVVSSLSAGDITLTMLALTIYLVGIYSDITFVFIGIVLAIFAYSLAYMQAYLPMIMIPVLIIAGLGISIVIHRQRKN